MSLAFSLSPQETGNLSLRAQDEGTQAPPKPGFFEGSLVAPVQGAVRSLFEVDTVLNDAFQAAARPFDDTLGTSIVPFLKSSKQADINKIKQFKPDPITTGFAGNTLDSLSSGLTKFGVGFLAGGPVGAVGTLGITTAETSKRELMDQGVDIQTATNVAGVEGILAGAGAVLPAAYGPNILKNTLLYGPATNLALGAGSRGATHTLLENAGYKDMAEQYKVLDGQAIIVDAVMGAAFGYMGAKFHPKPSDVDAALTTNLNQHLEVDTSPGLPKDLASREAHLAAMTKATTDLINGEPVDVSSTGVHSAKFEANPEAERFRENVNTALLEQAPVYKPSEKLEPIQLESTPTNELSQAQSIVSKNPELTIRTEDGRDVSAAELMNEANAHTENSKMWNKIITTAVDCFSS